MPNLTLDIPDDVADALRLPPDEAEQEVRKELAIMLYARQLLPLGKARKLADLSRRDFEALLGERQVPRDYTEADLEEDLAYARGDTSPESDEEAQE
jgi:predicted HTH domain antitoxin